MKRSEFNQWLEALRSGNYKQCFGKLTEGDGETFCALGLADFKVRLDTEGEWHGNHNRDMWSKVVAMNDCRRLPFPQIAQELEALDVAGKLTFEPENVP